MWFEGPHGRVPASACRRRPRWRTGIIPPAAYNLFSITRDGDAWRCEQRVRGFGDGSSDRANCRDSIDQACSATREAIQGEPRLSKCRTPLMKNEKRAEGDERKAQAVIQPNGCFRYSTEKPAKTTSVITS